MNAHRDVGLLTTIQGARGAAAVAVVLAHAGTILGFDVHLGHVPLGGAFGAGHAGVDFFFVLSGFIITTVHGRDVGHSAQFSGYIWKRLVRVYPVYWVATAIAITIAASGFASAISIDPDTLPAVNLVTAIVLMPLHHEPLLGAAWTLEHELLFYLVFGLLILHRGIGCAALASWLLWSVVTALRWKLDPQPWSPANICVDFLGSSYHFQFGAGMVAAALVERGRVPFPRLLAAAGVAGFLITAAAEDLGRIASLGQMSRLLYGLSATVLVAGLARAERRGLMKAANIPVFLGAASYSIYLVHVPVLMALAYVPGLASLPEWAALFTVAVAGVAAGVGLHTLVEKPLLVRLRHWFDPPTSCPLPATAD